MVRSRKHRLENLIERKNFSILKCGPLYIKGNGENETKRKTLKYSPRLGYFLSQLSFRPGRGSFCPKSETKSKTKKEIRKPSSIGEQLEKNRFFRLKGDKKKTKKEIFSSNGL